MIRDTNPGAHRKRQIRDNIDSRRNLRPPLDDRGFGLYDRPKAPRVGLYSNQGLVELGAYEINKLRRPVRVRFYEWKQVSAIPVPQNKPKGPRYDRMRLAHQYQSLLDSGEVQTRAELARYLGVSRARVTQVLKRLDDERSVG